ncbi:hypothetical protein N7457_009035 [Penicillium paradoxum]|uniref:uncharacterized protein n=1 Tax=Penicillium paradoxum TaxID=176176 RepID=UPI002547F68C|nr:uncharacterized protein N7457_009035 [Penicillium paradoxum]KAJ5774139.1 hypothetical protein N7457_009035 [Penicillium paradoxum]
MADDINPDEIFKTVTRPYHTSHRKYMKWMRLDYNPSASPDIFVRDWRNALTEVQLAFGFSSLSEIFIFNQFLAAVAANSATREWIDSLIVPMNKPPADTVMEDTYRDFLQFEARRLHHLRSI